jgi:hypothetical protein
MQPRFLGLTLLSSALLVVPCVALAQSPGNTAAQANRDTARALAEEGQRLLMAGKAAEALVKLEAADAAFHAPTITVLTARALAALGREDEAYAAYTRAVDERLAPDARQEWIEAQGVAAKERSEIAKRLGFIKLEGKGALPPSIRVDQKPVAVRDRIAVLPGKHTITWKTSSGEVRSSPVDVPIGQEVVVEISADVSPTGTPNGGAPKNTGSSAEEEPSSALLYSGIAMLAVGAAGIGAGIGLGVYAMSERDSLEASCQGNRCLASAADTIERGRAISHGSTASFAIGGAALLAGGILLGVHAGQSMSAPKVGVAGSPEGARLFGRFTW